MEIAMRTPSLSWIAMIAVAIIAASELGRTQGQKTLDMYFLDMEGGGGTLMVSPSGESLLVDVGGGSQAASVRDADRIAAAAKQAGVRQIDYLVITHYDGDHVGAVTELAARLPIRNFIDHGSTTSSTAANAQALYQAYAAAREKGRHIEAKPGDKVPIQGLDVQIVTSGGKVPTRPLSGGGASNPLCGSFTPRSSASMEDPNSVGVVIRLGRFRSMQLGDLVWDKEHDLVCPNNLVGTLDVYQTSVHGLDLAGSPAIVHALRPRVVVMNNGPRKGASPDAWMTVKNSPGLEDLWQVHYSEPRAGNTAYHETREVGGKDLNVPEQFIANVDDTTANFIKLSARQDGSFVVTNPRNGYSKEYKPRRDSK
jgi:beta-lactamase superfamily II metal-dependent hydrolase